MNKAMYLSISFYHLQDLGIKESPFTMLKELGVEYKYSANRTICDRIDFWGLSNVTKTEYKGYKLEFEDKNPKDYIGFGLNEYTAKHLEDWIKEE